MIRGGGTLFAGSSSRHIGPGHFGLLDLGDGVQKFSCHYEADLDRGGASVLDIRPLLWKEGWPVAGDNLKEGTFQIESVRTGTDLELSVQGRPVGGPRVRRGLRGPRGLGNPGGTNAPNGPPGGIFGGTGRGPIPPQNAAEVSTNWPSGDVDVRLANFLDQAQQKWTITALTNAGGYPGSPYFKITVSGTGRALAATSDDELAAVPAFTGAPEQLWRIDQLTDGSWRISPKAKESLALCAIGSSSATLSKVDVATDKQRWKLNPL
jgi:arabinan endo-1,5-alpha-L-arabinosidase